MAGEGKSFSSGEGPAWGGGHWLSSSSVRLGPEEAVVSAVEGSVSFRAAGPALGFGSGGANWEA